MRARRKAESQSPRVAIVMATVEPSLEFFQKQVDSLKRQTHPNWTCLITDDASDNKRARDFWKFVDRLVEADSRFRLIRNAGRVGVFHNFERGLQQVPENCAFV